jgi:D-psicose/D-tagatose/L-ribulose 3-epimerase
MRTRCPSAGHPDAAGFIAGQANGEDMKIGVNTLLWTAGFGPGQFHLLPQIKGWGFDGVEVARFEFDSFAVAESRRAIEDAGLECTFCSALTGSQSLVTDDAALRDRTRGFLLKGIETAAELGAHVFMGPFLGPVGYLPGRRRTEDEWKRGVEGIASLTPALTSHGVTIAIEPLNRFETYVLNTAADAARLCDEIDNPHVGVLLDTFHANIEEKTLAGAADTLGRHIKHVHTCENDRGIPGSGHVDWNGLFPALERAGYNDWLVIESFGFAIQEIAAAACIWRDLAPTADAIAVEGGKFLRRMTGKAAAA